MAKNGSGAQESRDIFSDRFVTAAVYWLPVTALVVSAFFDISKAWRGALWAVAFMTMGTACIVNALRCGRVHCYLTGPFFYLIAIVAVLHGLGIAPLSALSWNVMSLVAFVAGITLYYLPERLFGKYVQRSS
jgi:hypothetical protein